MALDVKEKSVGAIGKSIFGIVAALVVGGLGNGVWEYVLEPALSWSLVGALNIATLGAQVFKDDLYREIAKGFHEESSLSLAGTLYFWIGYGAATALFFLMRRSKKLVEEVKFSSKEIDQLEAIADGRAELDRQEDDLRTRISKQRAEISDLVAKAKLLQNVSRVFFAIGIAFFAWVLIGNAKDRYVNSAIVHYKQSVNIVAPAATVAELVSLDSRFAQVASKNDYERLMADIASIGVRKKLTIPSFEAW